MTRVSWPVSGEARAVRDRRATVRMLVVAVVVSGAVAAPARAAAPKSATAVTLAVEVHRATRADALCSGMVGCVAPDQEPPCAPAGSPCAPAPGCVAASSGVAGGPAGWSCDVDVYLVASGRVTSGGKPVVGATVKGIVRATSPSYCWTDASAGCAVAERAPEDPPAPPFVQGVGYASADYERTLSFSARSERNGLYRAIVGPFRFQGGVATGPTCKTLGIRAATTAPRAAQSVSTRTACA